MDTRQAIEYFHLFFSHRLAARVERTFFSLKGGCNLRFYFNSIRYSEDIDFDVTTISVETLKKNIARILDDPTFLSLLKSNQGIEVVEWSAPKQTETTQRWKVTLKLGSQSLNIPTKIEFSRRSREIIGAETVQVPAELTTGYKLQPILLQHYKLPKAIEQKIGALLNRTEAQARDVIDLQILKGHHSGSMKFPLATRDKTKVLETLMSISYDEYMSQVWPYLMLEYQENYKARKTWNNIQTEVVQFVEEQPEKK